MKQKSFLYLAFFFTLIDQLLKFWLQSSLSYHEVIKVIPYLFSITYVENKGGAFSFLSNLPFFFIIFSLVVIIFLVVYGIKNNLNSLQKVAFSCLIGGALGNLLDRIIKGSVVDYLAFTFGKYAFPVFNLADILVVCGVFLLLIFELLEGLKWKNK